MSFSRGIFWICLGFISGIFLASFFDFKIYFYFFLFWLWGFFFSFFYKRKLSLIGFLIFGILFGIFWEEKFERKIIPRCDQKICRVHFFNGKEITFEGVIVEEPREKEKSLQVVVEAKKLLKEGQEKPLAGKVLLIFPLGFDFKYGQLLKIKGRLQAPEKFTEDFDWPQYLRKEGIYSIIYQSEAKIISENGKSKSKAFLIDFKEKLEKIARNLPPPEGAILSAITLNDRSRISKEFREKLSFSGLSHIIAISGIHIIILFEIILSVLFFLGFWRKEATFLGLFFILLYILMIGAPSSAIRALIMGGFLYLAKAFGRQGQSSRALVFAGSLMLLQNPLILTRDISFQLSFLATLGMIYLLPILKKYFKDDSQIKNLILVTLSCQIFTLPLSLFNFGNLPLFGVISNILVMPILPILLSMSFLYFFLSLIFPWLSFPLSFILKLPYLYLTRIIEFFGSLLKVSLKLHFLFLIFFYLILTLILIHLTKKINKIK